MKPKKIFKILLIVALSIAALYYNYVRFFNFDEAQPPSEDLATEIDKIITTMYEYDQFSGIVLVSLKDSIIIKKGYGYANIEDSIPNTPDSKFMIASFTKPFTAMLILQLVEDGKLKLDGKLSDYLPEFTKKEGKEITIHQLLTHTSGMGGEWHIPNLIDIEKEFYTRKRLLDTIIKQDLVYEPGEGKEYSNFGYALLGLVIEKVSGMSYDEYMNEKICKPAGMKNTLSDVSANDIVNRAKGYTYNYFTGLEDCSFLDMSFVFGYGHLLSAVEDLYLFNKALDSNVLLSEESKKLFFDKYGWFSVRYSCGNGFKKVLSYSLDGSGNGFQSHTHRIENDSIFIVVLRNAKEQVYEKEIVIKWARSIVSRVLAIIYNEDYDPPKRSLAFTLFQTLIDSGYEEALSVSKKLKVDDTEHYIDATEFYFFHDLLKKEGKNAQSEQYKDILESMQK